MSRRLNGLITVNGLDRDWPDGDDYVSRTYRVDRRLEDGVLTQLSIPHTKWGGECRVEIDLSVLAVKEGDGAGNIKADIEARFYEGTSENTTELEDKQSRSITIARSSLEREDIALRNDDDDRGDVIIRLQNLPA
jgi:hypothetical protein